MKETAATCDTLDHTAAQGQRDLASDSAIERCARIFRAMGDASRLKLIARLAQGEACVGDLAELEGEAVTLISQRLRVLRADDIVRRKRDGKHVVYSLTDQHMLNLVLNGLAHAAETTTLKPNDIPSNLERTTMNTEHNTHANHTHQHGPDCGHTAIQHADHVDFLHNGHLHHLHDGHVDEHKLEVTSANPDNCTNGHDCAGHDAQHVHGPNCGHDAVPHGDHVDYLVEGHLHHAHSGHCDNHGSVQVVQ